MSYVELPKKMFSAPVVHDDDNDDDDGLFALRRYESFLRNSYLEELSMFARLLTYDSQAYNLLFGGTKVSCGVATDQNVNEVPCDV